jgi:psiF repeat
MMRAIRLDCPCGDKAMTPQQEKMKACNAQADDKKLEGDARNLHERLPQGLGARDRAELSSAGTSRWGV